MTVFESRENFLRAHSRARREEMLARIGGRPTSLLPFEVLSAILKGYQQAPRAQTEMVPLERIVGSVGRYKDFTRDFFPKRMAMRDRWAAVEQAMESMEGTPAIEVYRLGEVYFVADGNHRVSVARAAGFDSIEARVIDIPVDVDLQPGDSLDEAIIKAERARFLTETQLAERIPHLDIYFTRPGGWMRLLEHVHIHRRLLSEERGEEVALEDAAEDWYDRSYCPIIQAIRDRQLLGRFPGRTAADLYVWIWGYIFDAYRSLGEKIEPEEAAAVMELRAPSPFQQAVQGLMNRIAEVSRSLNGGSEHVPDWVTQTFEWDDGSLSQLAGER
ncbi:MAG: transcriptional regulator [Anaerolineae bacterium]|jgi:hypothetical protein|nr:transcriptional regulator [Anaerolineae bacterium]